MRSRTWGALRANSPPPGILTTNGKSLLNTLQTLVTVAGTNIYVTGHSLGGAVATMVALYLNAQPASAWTPSPSPAINLYTFAAPTAGDQAFANAVNGLKTTLLPNGPMCYVNQLDVVPCGYLMVGTTENPNNLTTLPDIYVGKHVQIYLPYELRNVLTQLEHRIRNITYVQPTQQPPLPGSLFPGVSWAEEAGYQHENNTYLNLLNAQSFKVPTPTITGISVNTTKNSVTITGTNFGYLTTPLKDSTFVQYNDLSVYIGLPGTPQPPQPPWVYQLASGPTASESKGSQQIICTPVQSGITENTFFAVCVITEYGSYTCTYPPPSITQGGSNSITATGEGFVAGGVIEYQDALGSWTKLTTTAVTAAAPNGSPPVRVSGPSGGLPSVQTTIASGS